MTLSTWLRSMALVGAAAMVAVMITAPPAYSKPKKKKESPTPTATMTATATATPEAKIWNFDSDKADTLPDAWQDVDGAGAGLVAGVGMGPDGPNSVVIPQAPSPPD